MWLASAIGAHGGETLRIATWNVGLERAGPGLLLRDLARGDDPQVAAIVQVLAHLDADAILLTGMDYDAGGAALDRLRELLALADAPYPHALALQPNSGVQTGLDIDHDGRIGGPRDAQGYGRFAGAGAMALLSRLPIDQQAIRDFTGFLWADLPDALLPADMTPPERAVQRLSSMGHWDVPLILPDGGRLHLLAFHATPPVFDGAEDRNGRRNHDEAAFWLRYLAGDLAQKPPEAPVILLGDANLDPADGDGRPAALLSLLQGAGLKDPAPRNTSGRTDPNHRGDPALDTVLYDEPLGGLRLDYVLPDTDLIVSESGVFWPDDADHWARILATASRHRPVWVDISVGPFATPL